MNRIKSVVLGSLLATVSILALSQNAKATEIKYQQNHVERNAIAFNQKEARRERELRERQARERRERQARERREREQRERQAREQRERRQREAFYRR